MDALDQESRHIMPEKVLDTERVARVEVAVENLTNSVDKISESIETIKEKVSAIGKTDFKTIIGVMTGVIPVIITVWLIFAEPQRVALTNVSSDVDKIERTIEQYKALPTDLIRVENTGSENRKSIQEIENILAGRGERLSGLETRVKALEEDKIQELRGMIKRGTK
jgi:hypothetical protein